jgi:hypothetical protein
MKRISVVLAIAALAVAAAPAGADRGAPGTTFPEQPGAHNLTACSAVLSNPGATTAPVSATAEAITTGLITDVCFGG